MAPLPQSQLLKDLNKNEKKEPTVAPINEMSEEDKQVKEEVEMLMERLEEPNERLYRPALELLRTLIRTSTTSMTSVPKPLKFLRPFYDKLKLIYQKIKDKDTKEFCSDIVSVLAMTFIAENQDCLAFRLTGSDEDIGSWGHEYIKHLSAELRTLWNDTKDQILKDKLRILVRDILKFSMKHNSETEACDLLMDIEWLELIKEYVDKENYQRVALYLVSCVSYVPEPDNIKLLHIAMDIYRMYEKYVEALALAMQLNDPVLIKKQFDATSDIAVKKQMAFILARHNIQIDLDEDSDHYEELVEILSNSQLNAHFMSLARELDIMEPKLPEDIYKTHLDPIRPTFGTSGTLVDSVRQNLASSFVNGFVNAGFGQDKLITVDGNKWIYKNKDHAMMSATASLGLIYLWDVDIGLAQIDKYLYTSEEYIKAGALMACGIVNTGVRNDCDPALALLSDYVHHDVPVLRIAAFVGLGLAYAGSKREDVLNLLLDGVRDPKASLEVVGMAALSCGMVAVGSSNGEVTSAIFGVLFEKSAMELRDNMHCSRFLALGLALTHLGKQESVEVVSAGLQAVPEPVRSMAKILLEACAYAGTGNVLKVQEFLHICSEHYEPDVAAPKKIPVVPETKKGSSLVGTSSGSGGNRVITMPGGILGVMKDKSSSLKKSSGSSSSSKKAGGTNKLGAGLVAHHDDMDVGQVTTGSIRNVTNLDSGKGAEEEILDLSAQQGMAVLGIALVAMGEDIGANMCFRTFGHLLRYGEPVIRRAVPLALALISVSNPQLNVTDTLSKFSHDTDPEVAHNAIFAMGIVGAGTNNARLAAMLRQLAQFHAKDPTNFFMVRIAQALVHVGKGTLTLSPYHEDRQLMSPVAVAGLLVVLVSMLDAKNTILGKAHYLLYYLTAALRPRFLITFDPNLNPVSVSVRVGQAVDVVGQAGKPKTITGFQTYTTPVLLGYGERAELATEEYLSLSPHMEGFVILKKNPNYMD